MTLTYEYGRSQVWLDDLAAERDPHAYDLCRRHADRLSVPLGWQPRRPPRPRRAAARSPAERRARVTRPVRDQRRVVPRGRDAVAIADAPLR